MDDLPDFRSDPAWLRLSMARRQVATARLEAIQRYEAIQRPVTKDVNAAALAAGVSPRLFYMLLKAWRAPDGRSIWTLVPHGRRKAPAASKLDPAVEERLHAEIRSAIDGGKRTPREILAAIISRWPVGELVLPRERALRSHIESAGGLDIIATGPFTLNASPNAQEEAETATRHGEVLVIDHTAPEFFMDGRKPRRATLTLAIDLYTATIAGFAIATGPPAAGSVLTAIEDACRRTAANPGEAVNPRIVVAATNGADWRALLPELARRGLKTTVRWSPRLHRGGPTKRLIGSRIAGVELQSRKTHDPTGGADRFDRARHALLTAEQAEIVIADAVARLNAERLAADEMLNRIVTGDLG